ncbi:hypothetical protein Purlil1_3339 [Purpureocillium lilacinum]|uniref:ADF-H domain-containing protein n=1 Tax=Purpureocillium lilacinum TaxID=33203 RepID=A0ABR0C7Y1_PURLI|nr:hypothetical protein Purlil1_3339 [Purpureocillium lilacinum]
MSLKIDNQDELREAQSSLFTTTSTSGWILLNYVGPSTVHMASCGEGDVADMTSLLEADQVQYAVVRLAVQQGGVSDTRDVFVRWIGAGVGSVEKNKKEGFHKQAKALLQPHQAEVMVYNKEKLTKETLMERSDPQSKNNTIDVPLGSQALEVKFLRLPKVQAMTVAEVNPNSEPERTVVNAVV